MGSNTATIMTLANSIIGVGVLAMPFCFKQCGIVLSMVMLILSSGLSRLACHFLLKAAIMARRRNFEFLAFHTFGPPGKTAVELFIIGFLMGTCIAFFVVVGDLGPAIVAKLFQLNNTASLRQVVLISLAVGIVLPLGLMRNVSSLAAICTATIGFYLCLVIKVMAEAIPHLAANDWLDKVHLWRPAGLLQCTPIFSMALFCQTQLFEIYESLPNANLDKMNELIRHAVNLCTGFYIFVGFFGYVAFFTQNFTGNILMSFTPTWASDAIKIGFVLSVAVSFPLVIFPCRASLYSLLFRRVHMPHETTSSHIPETRFRFLTIAIISASLTVGLITPNIELVLGLVGSTIGVLICVMFPAVAFICISTKSSSERLLAQFLLFVGVLILVLGTYATLSPAENGEVEGLTFPPDRIDSIARMSLLPAEKAVTPSKIVDFKNPEKVEPDEVDLPKPEAIKDSPAVDVNAAENVHPENKEVELPLVPELEKLDVRKEPPVPVEPPAENPPVMASAVPEKKEDNVAVMPPAESNQLEAVQIEVKKDANNGSSVKKILPEADKEKISSEQVNQDAIKKEDEELAEAEKQAKAEEEKKNEELLKKLEKHQEEQKKLLQEQKQILEELKEHKKEIDKAAAKKQNDDAVPQVRDNPAGDENKSVLVKIDSSRLIDSKLPKLLNIGIAQNKSRVAKDTDSKVANEVNRPVEKAVEDAEANQVIKNQRSLNLQDLKTMSEKALLNKRDKPSDPVIQNVKGLDNEKPQLKEGPNKLALPLPLAIRNLTSEYYKQQENVKADSPAKVMRRDILADEKTGFRSNVSQEIPDSNKTQVHDRVKRDTLLISNLRTQNKGKEEKCDINDDKSNVDSEPDKNHEHPRDEITADILGEFSNVGKITESNKNSVNDLIGGDASDKVSSEHVISHKAENFEKKKEEFGEVFTLSSLIRTPSLLSDPELSNIDVQKLKNTVEKIKDSSLIPKPMARDLKSLSTSQQIAEQHERKK